MTRPDAGPLLMVDIPGPTLDPDTEGHLRRHGIRAVCLFRKNTESQAQLARLCANLREVMGEEALIAIDHEGGGVVRPSFWPYPPSAMCLGAAQDLTLTEQVGLAGARQLRSVGINWNFAPVLDLNTNPQNPVISDRAYGDDPARVTAQALAAARGLQAGGVASCVKHFPGHGDTRQDSHHDLPRVDSARAVLDRQELAPFRAAVDAGIPAIMTAHIIYSALDPEHPATLSKAILTDLLRTEWGYQGVTITDSMGMQAIDGRYGRGEAAVLALRAGADMVMALGRREAQEATLQAVQAAIDSGEIGSDLQAAALTRLSALAARFPATPEAHDPQVNADLMRLAWARGLTTWRNPVRPALGSSVLLIAPRHTPGQYVSEAGISAETLAAALGGLYDLELHAFDDPAELDWPALRAGGRTLLLATTGRHRAPHRQPAPDLHLALWNAYAILDVDAPAVLTYGARPEGVGALRAWLAGEAGAPGQLPFTLPA